MATTTYYSYIASPVGQLFVCGDEEFLSALYLPNHKGERGPEADWRQADAPFAAVREQLAEYFSGARQQFDVPLKLTGTHFQLRVWQELVRIPFGTTISYAQLAQRLGQPTATRAVGNANGRNPVSIIVPCHRVIGANGKLTGYGGGMEKKEWLLAWERGACPTARGHLFDLAENLSDDPVTDRRRSNITLPAGS
jgi:methylated-DNA-[protein]-cysteine S-methyltransferase